MTPTLLQNPGATTPRTGRLRTPSGHGAHRSRHPHLPPPLRHPQPRAPRRLAGNAVCYHPDFRNGHAHISIFVHPDHRGAGAGDIAEVFISYLLDCFAFRKLYADVLAPNLDNFAGAIGHYFDIEARHREDTWL